MLNRTGLVRLATCRVAEHLIGWRFWAVVFCLLRVSNYVPYFEPIFHQPDAHHACRDLGGHEAVRHLWEDYACDCNAVIFLIDSSDPVRFEEVCDELDALIAEGAVEGAPLAIMLNKCDLETAQSSDQIAAAIGFEELSMRHGDDKISMFRISVLRGEGYQDAFKWISSFLQ